MCVRCNTGRIAMCTSPNRHGDQENDQTLVGAVVVAQVYLVWTGEYDDAQVIMAYGDQGQAQEHANRVPFGSVQPVAYVPARTVS